MASTGVLPLETRKRRYFCHLSHAGFHAEDEKGFSSCSQADAVATAIAEALCRRGYSGAVITLHSADGNTHLVAQAGELAA